MSDRSGVKQAQSSSFEAGLSTWEREQYDDALEAAYQDGYDAAIDAMSDDWQKGYEQGYAHGLHRFDPQE